MKILYSCSAAPLLVKAAVLKMISNTHGQTVILKILASNKVRDKWKFFKGLAAILKLCLLQKSKGLKQFPNLDTAIFNSIFCESAMF